MTSKTKTKKAHNSNTTHLAHEKDGTPWIVDQNGNKVKKVRKKVRRRASIGHVPTTSSTTNTTSASFEESQSSPNSMTDMRTTQNDLDESGKKMMSCRTVATEMSSSHHSSDHVQSFRSPKGKSPKKSKKSRSHKDVVDGQWWHIDKSEHDGHDDDDSPIKNKNKMDPKGNRLNQMEQQHSPSTPKKKKKKSVRHLSSPEIDYGSGHESPHGETVNTTGTGSLRPKPKRPMSSPDMMKMSPSSERDVKERPRSLHGSEDFQSLNRHQSGDLDMLMSQSVHDHIRKVPEAKPKLKQRSTLGKIGKKIGKSCKVLAMSSKKDNNSKDNNNINNDSNNHNHNKEDSSSYRSKSDNDAKTVNSSVSNQSKPLPKDIREIDGELWRVDKLGNKLNKVRRKNKNNNNTNSTAAAAAIQSWSSGDDEDDTETKSQRTGSEYNYSDGSSGGSLKPKKDRARSKSRRMGRRNSMGSIGTRKQDSVRSLYTDANETILGLNDTQQQHKKQHKKRKNPKGRSRSMDLTRNRKSKSPKPNRSPRSRSRSGSSNDGDPSTPMRQGGKKENEDVVQNLQHRLQNSEKEIARLYRVTMEQQEKMDSSKSEVKKVREKLKLANKEKQNLILEVETLKIQMEKRRDRSNKSLNGDIELQKELCDLEDEKESLERELASEKAQARHRLEAKEEEVKFLQEELERMRVEQGDKQLAYMQKMSISDDSNDSMYSSSRNSSPQSRRTQGKSLQFVGKILGNHLKDKAEMEVALQQEEIKNLQARVFSLQKSNEELTKELKQATLEIKDDDDEELRLAKEAAAKAAEVLSASMHNPKTDLKSRVMSLSRIHRSTSEADNESLSLSFRGGVGECVRRMSLGGENRSSASLHSQSFRINRKPGLY